MKQNIGRSGGCKLGQSKRPTWESEVVASTTSLHMASHREGCSGAPARSSVRSVALMCDAMPTSASLSRAWNMLPSSCFGASAAGSRSAAQTPVETPSASLAPWAEKTSEIPKGPSLKEIQEAEAKRAAEQEAVLMEARRLQMEQERLAAAQAVPPAPGLPLSSTWASSGSPSTPTTPGGSVWAKSTQAKAAPSTSAKKTLAQIQQYQINPPSKIWNSHRVRLA